MICDKDATAIQKGKRIPEQREKSATIMIISVKIVFMSRWDGDKASCTTYHISGKLVEHTKKKGKI